MFRTHLTRPKEIDQLHDPKMFKLESIFNEATVIWIYQTKITSVPPDRRWKPIPLIFPEQERIISIIKTGHFKRPLNKTIKRHFGEKTTLYGGRKGFTDLMISRNQRLEDISHWLGHRSIERTWKNYKDYRIVHYKKTS